MSAENRVKLFKSIPEHVTFITLAANELPTDAKKLTDLATALPYVEKITWKNPNELTKLFEKHSGKSVKDSNYARVVESYQQLRVLSHPNSVTPIFPTPIVHLIIDQFLESEESHSIHRSLATSGSLILFHQNKLEAEQPVTQSTLAHKSAMNTN